jgi:HPt (histidine-containing phosphotransfer) domain-containing protein
MSRTPALVPGKPAPGGYSPGVSLAHPVAPWRRPALPYLLSSMPEPKPLQRLPDDAWTSVLDAGALAKLQALDPQGQAGLVARVIGTYVTSLQRLVAQFAVARAAGDATALRHVAHTLKSSSASVGALALSGLCAAVEQQVRDGAPADALAPQLDALAAEAARVLAALGGTGSSAEVAR